MEIRTSFRPIRIEAPTKDSILNKINSRYGVTSYSFNNGGSGLYNERNKSFVLYNIEKQRSKRGVRKAHWKGFIYVISVDFLKVCGLKVIQNKRNFELKRVTD